MNPRFLLKAYQPFQGLRRQHAQGTKARFVPPIRLQSFLGELYKFVDRNCPSNLIHDLATLEKNKVWDRSHAILMRGPLMFIDVHLHDFDLSAELLREILKQRGNALAWATPRSPKIHQHSGIGVQDLRVEVAVRDIFN
jgi:hypothetical protein